jgi:hypothetical protein
MGSDFTVLTADLAFSLRENRLDLLSAILTRN